jgi:Phage terminase, small subunit
MAGKSEAPSLTIVDPTTTGPSPPRKLGAHGLSLWHAVQGEYHIDDPGGIEMLAQACTAIDRAEELAEQITRDGAIVQTRNGPRRHPALRDELAYRSFVTKTLERLGLCLEPVGRPGRPAGSLWSKGRADQ